MVEEAARTVETPEGPVINTITGDDISAAIRLGIEDFAAYPGLGLFFGAVYAAGGIVVTLLAYANDMMWLVFPAMAGFALIGPFIAIGLYEMSRRRAAGEPVTIRPILGAMFGPSSRQIAILGAVVLFSLAVWLRIAGFICAIVLGTTAVTLDALFVEMMTTPSGLAFTVFGTVIGGMIAMFVFAISVVSFPMLVDRDVDFVTALTTSFRAVLENPLVMIGWGILVAFLLAVALTPFFLGLVVALPILGHATWHLYKRVVA